MIKYVCSSFAFTIGMLIVFTSSCYAQVAYSASATQATGISKLCSQGLGATCVPSACVAPLGFTPIKNAVDLQNIQQNLSGKYFLCNDIDLSNTTITPIGSWNNRFKGMLDGNNKVISNLLMHSVSKLRLGLFDTIDINGHIKDLSFYNAIVSNGYAGCSTGTSCANAGVVSGSNAGLIENVSVDGQGLIRGYRGVGGITGNNTGIIRLASVSSKVFIDAHGYAGGIAGNNYGSGGQGQVLGVIEDSFSQASVVIQTHTAGGLVGSNGYGGAIYRSYAAAQIIWGSQVGALVGSHFGAYINNSPIYAVVSNSYASDIGLPFIYNVSILSTVSPDSGVFGLNEMTQAPAPPYLWINWNFNQVWQQYRKSLPSFW